MHRIPLAQQKQIQGARMKGKSIPEISLLVGVSKTTVQRYVQTVEVPVEYRQRLREKQGGAKDRAIAVRKNVAREVESEIGALSERDRRMLLIGMYWGEGTKKDFGLINSDPLLIQAFISSLYAVGITKSRLSLSLRVHEGVSIQEARKYWSETTSLPQESIVFVEVIRGRKQGKLPYGMCRVRVRSGIRERLHVQTAIAWVGKDARKRVLSK